MAITERGRGGRRPPLSFFHMLAPLCIDPSLAASRCGGTMTFMRHAVVIDEERKLVSARYGLSDETWEERYFVNQACTSPHHSL